MSSVDIQLIHSDLWLAFACIMIHSFTLMEICKITSFHLISILESSKWILFIIVVDKLILQFIGNNFYTTATTFPRDIRTANRYANTHSRTHARARALTEFYPHIHSAALSGFAAVTYNECGENARPRLHTNRPCLNVIYCTRGKTCYLNNILKKT